MLCLNCYCCQPADRQEAVLPGETIACWVCGAHYIRLPNDYVWMKSGITEPRYQRYEWLGVPSTEAA